MCFDRCTRALRLFAKRDEGGVQRRCERDAGGGIVLASWEAGSAPPTRRHLSGSESVQKPPCHSLMVFD